MAEMNFTDLQKKNKGFLVPQYSISVDGNDIAPSDFPVIDLKADMSAGFEMSACTFVLAALFDQKNGKFTKDIFTQFKPGKVVDVKMGYGSNAGVFKGYVNSIAFDFDGQSGPHVTVQCLDAKGALVNNRTWKSYGKQNVKAIVAAILKEKCGSYATISGIDSKFDSSETDAAKESPQIKQSMDDYNYIIAFAKKTNNSFCVIYDKLYFCENLSAKATAKVGLKWGESLLSFSTEVNISDQIGTVQVYGDDPVTQESFTAKADTIAGQGESGSDMAAVVKGKTLVVKEPEVKNKTQAEDFAKHTLEAHAGQLSKCSGSTIGIPQIAAGDKIEISGMGKGLDGDYYLNHVTHRINGQGYITSFRASRPKVKK